MNEFLELMEKHIMLLNDIIDTANRKFDAIAANDINALNKCISEDEANSLKFKGFDRKREALAQKEGVKTFVEYIQKLSGEEKEKAQKIHKLLLDRAEVLKAVNSTNERCIKLNLMQIDGVLEMLGNKNNSTYARNGGAEHSSGPSKFKSQRI